MDVVRIIAIETIAAAVARRRLVRVAGRAVIDRSAFEPLTDCDYPKGSVMRLQQSPTLALTAGLLICASFAVAQNSSLNLKIEDVMTADEMRNTGISHLTLQQREAFNAWLNRYATALVSIASRSTEQRASAGPATTTPGPKSVWSPAVESSITGDFNGWEGETVFKLDNGQIWEQTEYDYMYSYSYHPDVTIYMTSSGCRMKVEDENETILVRRIK